MASKPVTTRQKVAGGAAAAILLATPLISRWEGRRLDPYRDIVGVLTVCDGQTRVAMRRYSNPECDAMLRRSLETGYAPAVRDCVPAIVERPAVYAAAISLSYNVGARAFCRSTAANLFRSGRWAEGCRAFSRFSYAGGRWIKGLARRRDDETRLCLTGAA